MARKPKRSKIGQKRHDEAVLGSVKWYEGQGYKVKADLPNYPKPKKIGGFIPDWIAKKGKKETIGEVETKDTAKLDEEQHKAFRAYAKRKRSRKFKKKVI